MFIIQKRTSEKDYPCSLIRMHLIATSKDSIFQKEDFGWGLLFKVGALWARFVNIFGLLVLFDAKCCLTHISDDYN